MMWIIGISISITSSYCRGLDMYVTNCYAISFTFLITKDQFGFMKRTSIYADSNRVFQQLERQQSVVDSVLCLCKLHCLNTVRLCTAACPAERLSTLPVICNVSLIFALVVGSDLQRHRR